MALNWTGWISSIIWSVQEKSNYFYSCLFSPVTLFSRLGNSWTLLLNNDTVFLLTLNEIKRKQRPHGDRSVVMRSNKHAIKKKKKLENYE